MFKIEKSTRTGLFANIVRKAKDNGSLDSLLENFDYLDQWGNDAEYEVQVLIKPANENEFYLTFLDTEGKLFMNGGLVYCEALNDWGTHT